jgi:hypothetical protein
MPVQPHLIDARQTLIHEDDLSQEQARSWLQHLNNDRARRGDPSSERLLQRTRVAQTSPGAARRAPVSCQRSVDQRQPVAETGDGQDAAHGMTRAQS